MTTMITGIRTIGVPVTDQDKAVEFYVGMLGFHKRLDVPLDGLGGRWIEVGLPGTDTTLALVPAKPGAPVVVDTGIRLTTPDVEAAHTELAGHGVSVDDILRWPNAPAMCTFRDPFGHRLVIVEAG